MKILKLWDMLTLNNFHFIHDLINGRLPERLNDYFKRVEKQHNYSTRSSKEGKVITLGKKTTV